MSKPAGGASTYVVPSTGPVTYREIYELLLQHGLSTKQAIGVMANMWYESNLNPEAGGIDTNGFWAGGLISWNTEGYTNARMLVTGDPQKDVRAQMAYLFTSTDHVQQGLQGATAADVAHNWAQYVENCAECAPGAQQYNARGDFTSTIADWVSSGKWPTSGGGKITAGGGGGGGSAGAGSRCLVRFPLLGGCALSASQGRAVVGGLMIAAALPAGLVGAVILAAFAFRATGAGKAVGRSAEVAGGAISVVPGLQGAGAAVAAAGSGEVRSAQASERRRAERKEQRAASAQARNDEKLYKQARARLGTQSSRRPPPDDIPPF